MAFKQKLQLLLKQDYPFRVRLMLSLLIGFAFSFTFVFFGILDIFFNNSIEMQTQIQLSDVLAIASVAFFIVWAIISGILLLCPGKIFSVAACLVLGTLIAGYLQGNFLNVNVAQLTGAGVVTKVIE